MSESHRVSAESGSINLPAFEVGFASICVAIVAGSIGGNIGTLLTDVFPFWGLLIFILGLGFIIPWVVCKYLFKTAHACAKCQDILNMNRVKHYYFSLVC
ncbi:MAG: hypothetical protein IID16_08855 [Candidatus Marinimicrobia bacterium]|nr:hypothetical protein [Candidatus Neomarinimicrobiota bacterium]